MAEEFSECSTALKTAQNLIPQNAEDIRVKFCNGRLSTSLLLLHESRPITCIVNVLSLALMSEKRKDYTIAMEGYVTCLNQCAAAQNQPTDDAANSNSNNGAGTAASNEQGGNWPAGESSGATSSGQSNAGAGTGTGTGTQKLVFMKELRGEVMLRIAVLKKEMGAIDQSMQMCNSITTEAFGDSIRANALCLKVGFEAETLFITIQQIICHFRTICLTGSSSRNAGGIPRFGSGVPFRAANHKRTLHCPGAPRQSVPEVRVCWVTATTLRSVIILCY